MIPDHIYEFHQNNSLGFVLGTRDESLQPNVSKPFNAVISDDKKHITFFMNEADFGLHEGNFNSNGKIALSVGQVPSHESYQFKGEYRSHRQATEEEGQEVYSALQRFGSGVVALGFPPEMLEMFNDLRVLPAIAVTFEVNEIFEQTPKPGTGNKI